MMKRYLLTTALALLLCSCEPSEWSADATDWVEGLPFDNTCTLAEPLCLVEMTAAPGAVPSSARNALCLVAAESAPGESAPRLAAGTRAELLSVTIEHEGNTYIVYAQLGLAQTSRPVWLRVGQGTRPTELPLLHHPDTDAPLALRFADAIEYAEKSAIRR